MTPQEKAEELIDKFADETDGSWGAVIRCAIICADEIIATYDPFTSQIIIEYWENVKTEIEKRCN